MEESRGQHDGRVAVITGGGSGIGRAIALRLEGLGARVHVFDLTQPLESGVGSAITWHAVDVRDETAVEAVFERIDRHEGRLDYLVCCAAIFNARPFLELTPEHWQRTLDVNLTGTFLCCRAAVRLMRSGTNGRIVLFSSVLARTGGVNSAHYVASKGGVLGLARSLALEGAEDGIRVNVVSPGLTDTPQPRDHFSDEALYAQAAKIPLGRIGTVEDMAEACLFLLGDEASYVTGQDLRVNGGATLW